MADILRLCGIAVLGLCAVLILREKNTVFGDNLYGSDCYIWL